MNEEEQLRKLLTKSSLDVHTQEWFVQSVIGFGENAVQTVCEAAEQDITVLERLIENLKAKVHATQSQNSEQWTDIFDQEERYLNSIS